MAIADWMGLIGSGISAISNIGASGRQRKNQQALMDQQIEGAKKLTDYEAMKSHDMWLKTNIGPQKQLYEEAGMNPALMYGESGMTGTTQGAGMSMPTGGQAADEAQIKQANNQMGMQIAQAGLIAAQTEKTKAEAEKIKGVDTDLATEQTNIARVQAEIAGKTIEQQLDIIDSASTKAINEASISTDERTISNTTVSEKIGKIKQEYINLAIEAAAKEKGIELDNAKINEITNGIQQKWKELNIKETTSRYEHNDRIKAIEEYTENALKTAYISAGAQVVGDIIGIATKKIPTRSIVTHK